LNPSPIAIKLEKIDGAINLEISKKLVQNQPWESRQNYQIPNKISTPYWLLKNGDLGNYYVQNESLKGLAETPNPIKVRFHVMINSTFIQFKYLLNIRLQTE
jgi:hypothetical protein